MLISSRARNSVIRSLAEPTSDDAGGDRAAGRRGTRRPCASRHLVPAEQDEHGRRRRGRATRTNVARRVGPERADRRRSGRRRRGAVAACSARPPARGPARATQRPTGAGRPRTVPPRNSDAGGADQDRLGHDERGRRPAGSRSTVGSSAAPRRQLLSGSSASAGGRDRRLAGGRSRLRCRPRARAWSDDLRDHAPRRASDRVEHRLRVHARGPGTATASGTSVASSRPFRSVDRPCPSWCGSFSGPKNTRRTSSACTTRPGRCRRRPRPRAPGRRTLGACAGRTRPASTSISPTKPFSPGRPTLARQMNTMNDGQQRQPGRHAAVVGDLRVW